MLQLSVPKKSQGRPDHHLTHTCPSRHSYALNFAKVPYRTTWVPLGAVTATRDALHLAANRKHPDGRDFPTLPIIRDPLASTRTGTPSGGEEEQEVLVGDSFDIAQHLQKTYLSASSPQKQLFPGDATVALTRAFNTLVDEVFSQNGAPLAGFYMPLDPRTAEADKQGFVDRFPGMTKWEDFEVPQGTEIRKKMVADFEAALDAKLARCLPAAGEGAGPFVDGRERPMYADFIIGGWLQFMRGCLPEWEELRDKWSGGKWGRLFDALEEWAAVDGREGVVPPRR